MSEITRVPLPPVGRGVIGGLTAAIVLTVAVGGLVGACGARNAAPAGNGAAAAQMTGADGMSQADIERAIAAQRGGAAMGADPQADKVAAAQLAEGQKFLAANAKRKGVVVTASGLQYQVITPASGPRPTLQDEVYVSYEGKLLNGKVFDSSPGTGFPVSGVVPGFSEALQLMSKGARYRIWIPAALGYGPRSPDPSLIPPNAVLEFNLQLLDMRPAQPQSGPAGQ